MPDEIKRLIAVVGPTGIGKSRLAIQLAEIFNGEIVSADSRQVYRFLNIGTAKPSQEEMRRVPHHLIDIVDPDEQFSLAHFQEQAYRTIEDIYSRGKLPFLVGGTGLYVKAVLEGWQVPRVSPDDEFRYNIERRVDESGSGELYRELVAVDPEAAVKIDPHNLRRIIRALEVSAKAGKPFSRLGYKQSPDFDSYIIGLTATRAELYRIVDSRVDKMLENGLVGEVENLIKIGYDFTLPAMSGIGYKQIGQYLDGEITLETAVSKIKTGTHRFIRHQYAWFRLNDERIHWFDIANQDDEVIKRAVAGYLRNS